MANDLQEIRFPGAMIHPSFQKVMDIDRHNRRFAAWREGRDGLCPAHVRLACTAFTCDKAGEDVSMRPGVRCGGVAEWLKAHSAPKARVISLQYRVRPGVRCGGVAEWLKAHAWKVCMRETVSRVRIPPPPPLYRSKSLNLLN